MNDLSEVIQRLALKAEEDAVEKRIEIVTKVHSTLYEKAALYTNLILIGGYAGFFAVWANMKEAMSASEMLWSAIAVTVSLVVFIFWEVGKMIFTTSSLLGYQKALMAPPTEFDQRIKDAELAVATAAAKTMPIWAVVLVLTIVPGLFGAGVLVFSFSRQLLAG